MSKYEASTAIDLKIVVLGSAGVGKTSIIYRYCNGTFQPGTMPTIGAGFFTHNIEIDKKDVNLLLWDTAGEERFKSVTPSLLHGANGMILVYDVTSKVSFKELSDYYEMFLETCEFKNGEDLPILAFGNKIDKEDWMTTEQEFDTWCETNKVPFHAMCSAKTGEGIAEPIKQLVELILTPQRITKTPALQIRPFPDDEKKGCC
ncbi:small GTP-binding protein, putative [Trichomonas vaginalis G3]|uniref:Small GTP-binding protein, putative n=1 Tax=Trichomonas vaginalis (strain ATCC PRA-98 / G3) TaxID=412133 RepID=A2DT20_TRIV3|nr:GTPase protein [Trichomonas vaginalis G3]EAY16427.1 small GTP-binding protein, putative [Trichomonas vaginalis G3]KAI5505707.1 GTPase protein [Trichomonas vaginalis G3]|eukprot:XP_001328650.1 small GTP-binding protein [Trichomonas vaginalis G3]